MENKSGINIKDAEEIKKKVDASLKITMVLAGCDGKMAIEVLTGILVSVITMTANKGKEGDVVDEVTKALKDGVELMKNVKPMAGAIAAIIGQLQKNQSARQGGKQNMN